MLQGAQELLGMENLKRALDGLWVEQAAFSGWGHPDVVGIPYEDTTRFPTNLEALFGQAGGRGLALRIGRAAFKYGLKQYGEEAGLTSVEFRLLPPTRRLETGLRILSEVIIRETGDQVTLQDQDTHWLWRSERCPMCWGRTAEDACCYMTVGMLQEFMSWAAGGRVFRVAEVACRAAGAEACVYQIEKRPLD